MFTPEGLVGSLTRTRLADVCTRIDCASDYLVFILTDAGLEIVLFRECSQRGSNLDSSYWRFDTDSNLFLTWTLTRLIFVFFRSVSVFALNSAHLVETFGLVQYLFGALTRNHLDGVLSQTQLQL